MKKPYLLTVLFAMLLTSDSAMAEKEGKLFYTSKLFKSLGFDEEADSLRSINKARGVSSKNTLICGKKVRDLSEEEKKNFQDNPNAVLINPQEAKQGKLDAFSKFTGAFGFSGFSKKLSNINALRQESENIMCGKSLGVVNKDAKNNEALEVAIDPVKNDAQK
ncbi:MAG: hypothetical protein BGO07_01320 [Alphaproteobacteria bacterium 40-19]|nr:MAG: hypothetical protein BGO07_01320 [Alphaproteobacteria bacterium 40-19]